MLTTSNCFLVQLQISELSSVTFVLWTLLVCVHCQWTVFICWIASTRTLPLSLSLLVPKSAASRGLKDNTSLTLSSHVTETINFLNSSRGEVLPTSRNSRKFCPKSRRTWYLCWSLMEVRLPWHLYCYRSHTSCLTYAVCGGFVLNDNVYSKLC